MASGSRLGGGEAGTAVSPLCHTVSLWGCRTRHPPVGTEALPLGCAAWRPGLGGGIISAWVPLCSCPAAGAGHRLAQERRSGRDSPASVTENHHPVETPRVRSPGEGFLVVFQGFQGSLAKARKEHPVRTSWCSRPFLLKEERNRISEFLSLIHI